MSTAQQTQSQIRLLPEQEQNQVSLKSSLSQPLEFLVAEEGLDWEQKASAEIWYKPLPQIGQVSKSALEVEKERLDALLTPANDSEILQELLALRARYPQRDVPGQVADYMMVQDLEDFQGVPLDLMREACRKWRMKAGKEAQFMPSNGELYDSIGPHLHARTQRRSRVMALLKNN